jgi:hypothetical protein
MNQLKRVIPLVVLVCLLGGCSLFASKPWSERTPQEKSSYFMALYNAQYKDTMAMATNPNITEAQKKIVRAKREIFMKLWPCIMVYDEIVVQGEIPAAKYELEIFGLINRLAAAGG